MEDMCQLTERLTEDKYRGSMEQVAKTIRKFSSNPGLDVVRYFEVSLFLFLTANTDMHLKNFSLIHDENDFISLTPAYDMFSTRLLFTEKEDPEEFALTLNGKKLKLGKQDFLQFGKTIGLDQKQINNSLKRFIEGLSPAIKFIRDSMLSLENKKKLKELMLQRSERLELGLKENNV